MDNKPKVAVVIVNWNKREHVLHLLHSLKSIDYDNCETIVVDNASTDGSVEAINREFPGMKLTVNTENLGGTGGFNKGINHALEIGYYKYIWLLDNDAQVENNSLCELVEALERDESIGMAGSRIVDTERNDITVEAGAFIRWDTIDVRPLFRNKKNLEMENRIEEVDYVAVCSALIRVAALKNVGLMDERFFFFWDDMDWGLQFKEKGYRVVAILTSVVYHPAFTEKRNPSIDLYYGTRNALLTYSKHTNWAKRIPIFFNYMSLRSKSLLFWGMSGRKDLMLMGIRGIYDFIMGKWGGRVLDNSTRKADDTSSKLPEQTRKVLILNSGSRIEIFSVLSQLENSFPDAEFTLLVNDDRLDIYNDTFNSIIKINSKKQHRLIHSLTIFLKILSENYDIAVNSKEPSPFSFAVKKAFDFNYPTRKFIESKNNLGNVWKLILSSILGELIGIILLPIVYIASLRHSKA